MYSLELREVRLSPALSEDKRFESEDLYSLQTEVVSYITAAYPDRYNPVTVERLVKCAVRDMEGKTFQDRFDEKEQRSKEIFNEEIAGKQIEADLIESEYTSRAEEYKNGFRREADRIMGEYAAKHSLASPEEQEALKEEEQIRLDALVHEHNKKSDALWDEQAERKDAVWKMGVAEY